MPTVSVTAFVLSTRWGVPGPATSSGIVDVRVSGICWTIDLCDRITLIV